MISSAVAIAELFRGDTSRLSWAISYLLSTAHATFTPEDMARASHGLCGTDTSLALARILAEDDILRAVTIDLDAAKVNYAISKERAASVFGEALIVAEAFRTRLSGENKTSVRLVATPPRRMTPHQRLLGELTVNFAPLWGAIRGLIERAERSIVIVNPFFDNGGVEEWGLALVGPVARGVPVTIITRYLSPPSDRNVRYIRRLGIPSRLLRLFEFTDDGAWMGVHAKMVIVDDSEAYLGSANATLSSLAETLEVGVILSGVEVGRLSKLVDIVRRTSVREIST